MSQSYLSRRSKRNYLTSESISELSLNVALLEHRLVFGLRTLLSRQMGMGGLF